MWSLVLVGPFPRDRQGKRFHLTAIDHLIGLSEAISIPSKNADGIANAFMQHIIAQYGVPWILLTDNGWEFTSTAFKNWLADYGIKHIITNPYPPATNGKCKKFNGILQNRLKCLRERQAKKLSKYLPDAQLACHIRANQDGISLYEAEDHCFQEVQDQNKHQESLWQKHTSTGSCCTRTLRNGKTSTGLISLVVLSHTSRYSSYCESPESQKGKAHTPARV